MKCQVSARHIYCLDELPETFDEHVTWVCEDCVQGAVKKRRLIYDGENFDKGINVFASVEVNSSRVASGEQLNAIENNCYVHAQPTYGPIWYKVYIIAMVGVGNYLFYQQNAYFLFCNRVIFCFIRFDQMIVLSSRQSYLAY